MCAEKIGWDSSQLRKYDLHLDEIPRLHYEDPKVDEFMQKNVIFTYFKSNSIMH